MQKSFEVVKDFGTFGDGAWSKHLALVSWYGREPKFDIRPWNDDMTRPGKGIILNDAELYDLMMLIEGAMDGDEAQRAIAEWNKGTNGKNG